MREKNEARKRLDALGHQWVPVSDSSRMDAAQQAIWFEIFSLAVQEFDPMAKGKYENKMDERQQFDGEAFIKAMTDVMTRYDPKKGMLLSNYISVRRKQYRVKLYRETYGRKEGDKIIEALEQEEKEDNQPSEKTQVTVLPYAGDANPHEKKPSFPLRLSLDAPLSKSEDNDGILMNAIAADGANERVIEIYNFVDRQLYELTAQIMKFYELHTGRKANATRLNYYRVMFTADIIEMVRRCPDPPDFQHESEIVGQMKAPFVDFCMTETFQTLLDIHNHDMKRYFEVLDAPAETKRELRISVPIESIICASYLVRVEEPTRTLNSMAASFSTYLNDYNQEMAKLRPCNMTRDMLL